MASPVRRLARAKINLYLHVTGRRDDGYHLLDSLVAFAEFGDSLEARPAAALTLRVSGPFASALERTLSARDQNLVLSAARKLARSTGVTSGAALNLVKRLPVAAGIGGGSADAAAALSALVELWRVTPSSFELDDLALRLGADVPVCLSGQDAQFVGGIGEKLEPAPKLPATGLLLVNPGTSVTTAEVFEQFDGEYSTPARFVEAPADSQQLAEALARRRNDLEAAALVLAPEVARVLRCLEALPGALLARMSGSGATCFALFADQDSACHAACRLRRYAPDWWIMATRLASGPASTLT